MLSKKTYVDAALSEQCSTKDENEMKANAICEWERINAGGERLLVERVDIYSIVYNQYYCSIGIYCSCGQRM